MVQAGVPVFTYGDMVLPAGQKLFELFLHAAWYIPVFFFFLASASARGERGKKQFSLLLFSLFPFITAVLYLHILFSGDGNAASSFVTGLFGRNAAAAITGIILILQLALFLLVLLGLLGKTKKDTRGTNGDIAVSVQEEVPVLNVIDDQDTVLRFPAVPDVPEMNSFKKKFAQARSYPEEEVLEDLIEEEGEFYDGELGDEGEPQYSPEEPDVPPLTEYEDLIVEKGLPEHAVSSVPKLPKEDPHFQNLVVEPVLEKDELEEIDRDWARREAELPTLRKKPPAGKVVSSYTEPPDTLLSTYPEVSDEGSAYTQEAAAALMQTFKEFGIEATLTGIQKGPVVTMFEILPAPGVRVSSITNLSDNIALQLAASRVRIVAPIPGKQAVGIEVPNRRRTIVSFKEMLKAMDEHSHYKIPMVLGKDIMGKYRVIDLVRTPHLLIAGATGSGKSVCVNALICSILYRRSPKDVRLMLIDPKIVELKLYNGIPHLLTPVITDAKKTLKALQYCIYEMERRYQLLDALGVRDISSYNAKIKTKALTAEHIPYIVVVIDEFADLMSTIGKELEHYLARLAAMARAVGIHLVLATQRPSTNVITGLIKANIPSRIAFMVVSNTDSRIIIDMPGAEKLLGKGDMLFLSSWEAYPTRIQGAFLSEEEVERVVEHVKENGEPDYLDDSYFLDDEDENGGDGFGGEGYEDDPLMGQALRIVQERSVASASMLQRRLKIGYNRAARLIESMEEMGIVGPAQGSKPREVLRYQDIGDV